MATWWAFPLSLRSPLYSDEKNGAVPAWDDLELPQVVRDFTAAVLAVQERKVDGVCAMLDPYVQAGPGTVSLQLYMLIFRYYIEAMAIGPHSRPEMHKKLEAFLNVLPPGGSTGWGLSGAPWPIYQ